MRQKFGEVTARTIAVGVLSVALGLTPVVPSYADATQAKALFKAMSDYLDAQKDLSFDYGTDLEVVTRDQQKLGLASSGTVNLKRPDQLLATRQGGFANVEVAFDGKTLTVLGKNANAYAQADAPGTVDQLIDQLRDKYRHPLPGADLLQSDIYDKLMPMVVDVKDLGSGVIGGVECNHLAFRTSDVDWQIWIAAGERPYPCRYVITSRQVAGAPEYRLDVRNWKSGSEVGPVAFNLQPPADARKVDLVDLRDADELPNVFAPGEPK